MIEGIIMTEYKDFRISVGDDPEHEDLTAEIYYQELFVALLSQEQGFNELQVEIFENPNGDTWSFSLEDFIKAIELSKKDFGNCEKLIKILSKQKGSPRTNNVTTIIDKGSRR